MRWVVLFSEEVRSWYVGLSPVGKASADRIIEGLAERGHQWRMPHAKPLGDGLFELRFTCENVNRRISYVLDPERKAMTLTTFRKQRMNERVEILRARRAQAAHAAELAALNDGKDKKGREQG